MYLLPAGSPPRTKNKWGLGAIAMRAMSNGGGVSNMIRLPILRSPGRPLPGPILPGPMPVWPGSGGGGGSVGIRPTPQCDPGDTIQAGATWDPVGCQWVPNSLFVPPNPPVRKIAPPASPTAGSPVPPGYPVNQFFVAPDGSVWEYSTSANQWINTGTPYNTGAGGGGATSSTPTATTSSGATQPVSVTVNAPPAPTSSGYQAILDWLTQTSLAATVGLNIPNWIVAGGLGLIGWKMFGGGKK